MDKKYELLQDDFIEFRGNDGDVHRLFRIRALKDFGLVNHGDRGGYIETEANLSHEGKAWVGADAEVSGNARVYEDAIVCGDCKLSGNAQMLGNAYEDYAEIEGDIVIDGRPTQSSPSIATDGRSLPSILSP